MRAAQCLLVRALRKPAELAAWPLADWDLVIRQARTANLLARLTWLCQSCGIWDKLPAKPRSHLEAAAVVAERQNQSLRWELACIAKALRGVQGSVVLLKGAAYFAAGLPPAEGRLFSDIDLLVEKSQMARAETDLMIHGWHSTHHSAYDQRYYRKWMHEIPPLQHVKRLSVIDLHHNILPETARIRTRPELIIAAAKPLEKFPRFSVPDPLDLVLHSASHLFHEGEWEHGLRDLVDLDALLRSGALEAGYWDRLLARADELNLGRPLFYGLRYCQRLLATPVPEEVAMRCPGRPSAVAARAMDGLFVPAFATAHASCRLASSGFAAFALYVRSHWLRMPMHLLLPHLAYKAWIGIIERRREANGDRDKPARLPAGDGT